MAPRTPPPPTDPKTGETASLATYYIFESKDGGKTWGHIGSQKARSADHARKQFLPDDAEGLFVAVSSNHWRPRREDKEVVEKRTSTEFDMPLVPVPEQGELVPVEPDETDQLPVEPEAKGSEKAA